MIEIYSVDTAGTELYRSLARTHFQGADAFIIVYDITSQRSFREVKFWLSQIELHGPEQALLTLVGNKEDLIAQEVVSVAKAEKLAKKIKATFAKTSAQSNFGVTEVFQDIAQRYLAAPPQHKAKQTIIGGKPKPVKRCC